MRMYQHTCTWIYLIREMIKLIKENLINRLFFLRSIAQVFTQIYLNCFVSL